MKLLLLVLLLPLFASTDPPVVLVIHGGAGSVSRDMPEDQQAAYRAGLEEALLAGYEILSEGGAALDAVTAAIVVLEDNELFNSGRGAVLTNTGTAELDASIMDGRSRNAGAVAGVMTVRNPILAARMVMESSPHVMMAGRGAESFAASGGLEVVTNDYFITSRQQESLRRLQEREEARTGAAPALPEPGEMTGTVGAVARDTENNIAAGTSTGGMTNKRYGRIGDSPIIGAGTYATDHCGVSSTGHGEYFIRLAVAYAICARMEFLGETIAEASDHLIHTALADLGGTGGVIALDSEGNVAMPFNTPGMFRGTIDSEGNIVIEMFGD